MGEKPCGVNQKIQNRRHLPLKFRHRRRRRHRHRARSQPVVRSVAGLTAEVVQPSGGIITSTLLIKGEVRGSEDLYIDGEVQGTIQLSNGRVTVGPHGKISADVDAREIIVRGKVTGRVAGPRARGNRVAPGKSAAISQPCGLPSEKARKFIAKWKSPARTALRTIVAARSLPVAQRSMPQAVAMKASGENGN